MDVDRHDRHALTSQLNDRQVCRERRHTPTIPLKYGQLATTGGAFGHTTEFHSMHLIHYVATRARRARPATQLSNILCSTRGGIEAIRPDRGDGGRGRWRGGGGRQFNLLTWVCEVCRCVLVRPSCHACIVKRCYELRLFGQNSRSWMMWDRVMKSYPLGRRRSVVVRIDVVPVRAS